MVEKEDPIADADGVAEAEAGLEEDRARKQRGTMKMRSFAFGTGDVREDIRSKYGFDGDLLEIYASGSDRLVHKWHHYIPLYDRYLGPWRGRPLRFLEIGVSKGGSLAMWRRYFGAEAVIFGIDINPRCSEFDGRDGAVRIGSQDDPEFLAAVVEEMGGIDVVLDDGSHEMAHIRTSFELLYPKLAHGGLYMIEDLHTCYWPTYGGGLKSKENFFNFARAMVDDMHRWYHGHGERFPGLSEGCTGIHLHDSICVFEKERPYPPTHSKVLRRE